jgi:hypothetical protein
MADKPKSLPLMLVDWVDADTATDGWEKRTKIADATLKTVHSCGFAVVDDKDKIVLVTDYDPEDDNANGGSVIPRKMIVRIKRLGTWRAK